MLKQITSDDFIMNFTGHIIHGGFFYHKSKHVLMFQSFLFLPLFMASNKGGVGNKPFSSFKPQYLENGRR